MPRPPAGAARGRSRAASGWEMARDRMSGLRIAEGRLPLGAHRERMRAARVEGASARDMDQARRRATDRHQPLGRRRPARRDRSEQAPRVRMLGLVEDGLEVASLGDPAGVHDGDVVSRLGDHPKVVGDQDDGRPVRLLEVADQVEDLSLHRHVERGRRLVGDQDLGVEGERHGDHHPLSHAAGELVRVAVDSLGGARDPDLPSASSARAARLAPRRPRAPGSPRRSAIRPCRAGGATTADPGRSSRCACRGRASARPGRVSRSSPSRRTRPSTVAFGNRVRPMTVRAVTLLPDPDSPTIPSVRPRSRERETPSTALTTPSRVAKRTSQVLDLEQRHLSTGPAGRGRRRGCRRRCWRR